jgi:hypothetical protein
MIYNVYNEVVCDYNCENCDVVESCTDKIESNNMNKYNKKVVERIKKIFAEYNIKDAEGKDFYSYIASIIYNKPYEDCLEFYDNSEKLENFNTSGKELRMRVKQMLIPIIIEYGGLFEE